MLRSRCCVCILCALIGLTLALLLVLSGQPAAQAQQPAGGAVSFINDVAPILKENCFACHDAKKKKGKLDVTTFASLRVGGTKDSPISAGQPEKSVLVHVLTSKGPDRMPPKEAGPPLPKEKVEIIARWIKEGAKLDADIGEKADLVKELRVRWKPPAPPAAYKFPVNINALAFSPDGKNLVVGGHHELTVWNADGKLEKRVHTRAERAYGMVFLRDGTLAVAGGRPGQEGDVRIYDISGQGKDVGGVAVLDGVNDPGVQVALLADSDDAILGLALSDDGKLLAAAGCDRQVRVWDVSGGAKAVKLEQNFENHADWVFGLAFSADGKHLLTASRDKTAKIWDLGLKESVATFPDHQQPVYAVAITPDGKTAISCGDDNNLRYWEATDAGKKVGKQIRPGPGHSKAVFRIAYYKDDKNSFLATCSADGTVRLWNPVKGTVLKTLSGHTDWVYAVAISPDGKQVAAGGWNGEVRVWNVADGAQVRAFNASPGYVAKAEPKK